MTNPYDVLGVARDAEPDEIKAAYRRLALRYHPDRNPGDAAAEERFKEVSEAYATLRDPASRQRYDRYGAAGGVQGRPDFSRVDWQTIFQEADLHIDPEQYRGVPRTGNAIFDALFGAVAGMMRTSGLLPGEHRELELAVPVRTAREGGAIRVRVPGPSVCPTCRGAGRAGPDGAPCGSCGGRGQLRGGGEVEVAVPAGVRDGTKLRLRGLGGPGNPPGDALITVRVQLPEGVRLVGGELHAEVAVTPLEAGRGVGLELLGTRVRVPPGTRDGQRLRVAGGGLSGGDLVVTVRLDVWRGLWRATRDWFRQRVEE